MLGPNVIFELMYHEFVAIVGFFIIRVVSEVAAPSVIGATVEDCGTAKGVALRS